MTDYGITIRNKKKVVIIDSQYKNYTFYEGGTANLSLYSTLIPIEPTEASLITIIQPPTDHYVNAYGINDSTNGHSDIIIASSGTTTCKYAVYKDGQSTTEDTFGMIIYDSSGSVVFNSNELGYLKPIARYSYTPPWLNTSTTNVTVQDTDNNYFVLMGGSTAYYRDGATLYRYLLGMKKINSTTLRLDHVKIHTENVGGSGSAWNQYGYFPQYVYEFEPPPGI